MSDSASVEPQVPAGKQHSRMHFDEPNKTDVAAVSCPHIKAEDNGHYNFKVKVGTCAPTYTYAGNSKMTAAKL